VSGGVLVVGRVWVERWVWGCWGLVVYSRVCPLLGASLRPMLRAHESPPLRLRMEHDYLNIWLDPVMASFRE